MRQITAYFHLLLMAILFAPVSVTAQAPAIQWQKCYGGSEEDIASAIIQTRDGQYVFAGHSYSVDGDLSGSKGISDFWIAKLDTSGSILWQRTYGGSQSEQANDIIQTSDGGYIAAGYTFSYNGDVTDSHGSSDYWVLKLDDTGAVQWKKCYGGSHEDVATAIKQTADGGYIVAGSSDSKDGQVTDNRGGLYRSDFWIVKLDDTGAIQWQRSLGGTDDDGAAAIEQLEDGGYLVAGNVNSGNWDVSGYHGNGDYWVMRLNDTGTILWEKCLGGSGTEYCTAMCRTSDGNFVVLGNAESVNGDVKGNHGVRDIWAVKLSLTGTIIWKKAFGGTALEVSGGISPTPAGGVLISGAAESADYDLDSNQGDLDAWILQLDRDGDLVWQRSFGGSQQDRFEAVLSLPDGSAITAGSTFSKDGDILINKGWNDALVVKFATRPTAQQEWGLSLLKLYPNPFSDILSVSVPAAATGNRYILTDITGRPVLSAVVPEPSFNINTAQLARGMYFLHMDGFERSYKLLKN